jgi:hypothetical protein
MALLLYLGWVVVLGLTAAGMNARRRHAATRSSGGGWTPQDLDLADATALGRADVLLRTYPDSPWGKRMVAGDRRRLAAHGYVLVELEADDGAPRWAQYLDIVFPTLLIGIDPTSAPTLVATFKRASLEASADGSPVPSPPAPRGARTAPRAAPVPGRRVGRRVRRGD